MWHEQNESLRCSELLSLCVRSSSVFVLPGICLSRSHSAAALVTLLPRQGLDPLLISSHARNKLLFIRICCLTCWNQGQVSQKAVIEIILAQFYFSEPCYSTMRSPAYERGEG